jgi:hypothetical protein
LKPFDKGRRYQVRETYHPITTRAPSQIP